VESTDQTASNVTSVKPSPWVVRDAERVAHRHVVNSLRGVPCDSSRYEHGGLVAHTLGCTGEKFPNLEGQIGFLIVRLPHLGHLRRPKMFPPCFHVLYRALLAYGLY